MNLLLAFAAAAALQTAPQAVPDGPIVTGAENSQAAIADRRRREAIAYTYDLPQGAPTEDYPLVAWCAAIVSGHADLGATLSDPDELDRDLIQLGRAEAASFRRALAAADSRVTPAQRRAAAAATEVAQEYWAAPLASTDEAARSRAFGLFTGLPGRCEHAARRVTENITTPPATLAEVGISEDQIARPTRAPQPVETPEVEAEADAPADDNRSITERLNSTPGA